MNRKISTRAWLAFAFAAPLAAQGLERSTPVAPPFVEDVKTPWVAPLKHATQDRASVRPTAAQLARPPAPELPTFVADSAGSPVDRSRVHYMTSGDGKIWARGATYKASFGAGAYTYVPFLGSHVPRSFPIEMRLSEVRVAGEPVAFDAAAGATRTGDSVRFERGALVERYELGAEQVEQLIELADAPYTGAVELTFAVATDMVCVTTGEGLEFTSEHGSVGYTQAVALDAAGRELLLPTEWTGDGIAIQVPDSFLATAAFPVVVDPVMATITIDTYTADLWRPDVAYDVTSDEYLVVYQEIFSGGDGDVYSRLIDASGAAHSGSYIDSTSDNWSSPRVANNNWQDKFLIVASIGPVGTRYIGGKLYEMPSQTVGSEIVISPGTDTISPDVGGESFNGTSYFMVVWERVLPGDHDIHAQLVTPDGTLFGGVILLENSTADDRRPAISKSAGHVNGYRYCVVWDRDVGGDRDIYGAELDWDGDVMESTFLINDSSLYSSNPEVSSYLDVGGTRTFVTAFTTQYTSDSDIWLTAIQGSAPVSFMNLSVAEGDFSDDELLPAIDSDGLSFAASYAHGTAGLPLDMYAASLGFVGGQLCLGEGRQPFGTAGAAWNVAMTSKQSGGGEPVRYMMVWMDQTIVGGANIEGGFFDGYGCGVGTNYCGPAVPNSTGASGRIHAHGTGAAADPLLLIADRLPTNQFGYFLVSRTQGFLCPPFSVGCVCLGGDIGRFNCAPCGQIGFSGPGGSFFLGESQGLDLSNLPLNIPPFFTLPGDTLNFQCWYRDVLNTNNFTDGVRVTFF